MDFKKIGVELKKSHQNNQFCNFFDIKQKNFPNIFMLINLESDDIDS